MIIILFAIFGVLFGLLKARRLGGRKLDMVQYAAGYGIAMALLGLLVAVIVTRVVM